MLSYAKCHSFCLCREEMFALTVVVSLRYYQGNLGVAHDVILMK